MFLNKAISLLLATTIFIESSLLWMLPINKKTTKAEITPTIEVIQQVEDFTEEVVSIAEEKIEEVVSSAPPIPSNRLFLSEEDIDLITLVTMAEAEGEPEEGKRLVIDVILNRYESTRFPNTIEGVIYAKNAFECMWNGRVDRCYVRDDIRQLVVEEIESRTHSNIHYFRADRYHSFGKPVVSVGNHYFSTY